LKPPTFGASIEPSWRPSSHPIEQAHRVVFVELGTLTPCQGGMRLDAQADDLEWMARELARLPFDFTIKKPAVLRRALVAHGQALIARSRCQPER